MVLLGCVLGTYLLSFELAYPNLIFAIKCYHFNARFCKMQDLSRNVYCITAETYTCATHPRTKQGPVENRHGREHELENVTTRG